MTNIESIGKRYIGNFRIPKALAGLKGIPGMMQEEFFVAGLLHDVGKIPLNNCFAEEYRQGPGVILP